MIKRNHVIIAGTGRTGTTFLVQLLHCLGLETVNDKTKAKYNYCDRTKCGLEYDVLNKSAPYICKDPRFYGYANKVFAREDIVIEHIFIPIRDLYNSAASRLHVHNTFGDVAGGIYDKICEEGNINIEAQKEQNMLNLYSLMFATSKHCVPVTFINYPLMIYDKVYLYNKLNPILKGIVSKKFDKVFNVVVHPEWVHDYSKGIDNV